MNNNRSSAVYLTVGNLRQKELYESAVSELEYRYNIKIGVISDDELGCRIGSGGAVLKVIAESYEENAKIIIINSGGMSKRAVNFALKGKALAGIESDGEALLMLDVLIANALKISANADSGVLVCCSDILIDAGDIDRLPEGNLGFCIATDEDIGSRHGVLFGGKNSELICFAHKKPPSELQTLMNRFGRDDVLSDTGWVFFDADFCKTAKKMFITERLFEIISEKKTEINLYSDILPILCENADAEEYFKSADIGSDELKKLLFRTFSKHTLKVFELKNQEFLHFGSIREYLLNVFKISGKSEGSLRFNSFTDKSVKVGNRTVLDTVLLKGDCRIGGNCLISDVSLSDVAVPDGKSVCGFRQKDGSFITVVCDIEENPKIFVDGKELWETPRFYKGKSFSESYLKFMNNSDEPKFSLKQCTENADYKYFKSFSKYLKGLQTLSFNREYAFRREQLLKNFFEGHALLDTAECTEDAVEIGLPVRINLSGTWTDAMPYCNDNGGAVINAAVTVEDRLPIKVTAERLDERIIEFVSDCSRLEIDLSGDYAQEYFSDFNLHFAVLKTMGINNNTRLKNGFRLTTCVSGIEKGSGLGTSSILLAGCFMAMSKLLGFAYSKCEIIRMVFIAEQIMNTGGGWQDQAGALFPGVKISASEKGIDQDVEVREICLSDEMKAVFNDRAILVPTGERHFGRFVVNDVADRYIRGVPETLEALKKIKSLNETVEDSLKNSDEESFFNCINRHCDLLKEISPKVTNKKIDRIIARLRGETEAISICGAGAGGYLLTFLKDNDDTERIKKILKTEFPDIKSDILKVNIYY